jgi:hypothetical protein
MLVGQLLYAHRMMQACLFPMSALGSGQLFPSPTVLCLEASELEMGISFKAKMNTIKTRSNWKTVSFHGH